MSLSPDPWPYAVTLDEALQTVITARQQYHIANRVKIFVTSVRK